ncbi:MAG TPA: S1C family serine protease [Patescibacteria group bacterium]|nr:S1C family serine protease [Patescibacteria group bacterium]
MTSKQRLSIIIASVFIAFALDVLFGGYVRAWVQSISFVKNLHIYTPDAPVIIEKKEQVIVRDEGDISAALQANIRLLVTIYLRDKDGLHRTGSGVFLSREGVIATSNEATPPGELSVVDSEGRIFAVTKIYADPASRLVILQSTKQTDTVPDFITENNLKPGLKVAELALMEHGAGKVSGNYISQISPPYTRQPTSAERASALYLELQYSNHTEPGSLYITHESEMVGISSGGSIIPASMIKSAVDQILAGSTSITRPSFGFSLREVPFWQGSDKTSKSHILITNSQTPLLKEGDKLVSMEGQTVTPQSLMGILAKVKAGSDIRLEVVRGTEKKSVTIKTSILK